MTSMDNTLSKSERLSGKKSISTLLSGGKWGSCGHFRYCWMARPLPAASGKGNVSGVQLEGGGALPTVPAGAAEPGRLLVSVPKRFFKRAVKRNLLKRRIREAYRVRKISGVDILLQYNSQELTDFAMIEAEVTTILERIGSAAEDNDSRS